MVEEWSLLVPPERVILEERSDFELPVAVLVEVLVGVLVLEGASLEGRKTWPLLNVTVPSFETVAVSGMLVAFPDSIRRSHTRAKLEPGLMTPKAVVLANSAAAAPKPMVDRTRMSNLQGVPPIEPGKAA